MSLRDVLALPRKVLRREKGRMEMMGRERGREIMNMKMSVAKGRRRKRWGKKGVRTRRSLDSPDALLSASYHRGGELSSGIANSNGKCLTSWTTTWKRAWRGAHLSGVSANGRTIPKSPGVSIKDDERDYDGVLSPDDQDDAGRIITPPLLDFSFNITMISLCRTNVVRRYLIRLRRIMDDKREKRWKKRERKRRVLEFFRNIVLTCKFSFLSIYRDNSFDLQLVGVKSVRKQK